MDLSVLKAASDCDERHPVGVAEAEVVEVLATRQWCSCEVGGGHPCHSYCDTYGAALYLLTTGQYAVVTEWSDTSGHG